MRSDVQSGRAGIAAALVAAAACGAGAGCARIDRGKTLPAEAGTPALTDAAAADVSRDPTDTTSIDLSSREIVSGRADGAISDVEPQADGPCLHEIKAVVRDFRGHDLGAAEPRHPDFEGPMFTSHKGVVAQMLGADRKPVYLPPGATPATTGKIEFDEWYRDTPGVNMRFDDIVLALVRDPARPNLFVYDDQTFFPINTRGWDDSFGDNFHFTTEIHIEFPYKGGEVFTFTGDDDLFLFINGQLAIDLGGVHPAQSQSVDLDARATSLGIQPGRTYPMDIFHAERHTSFSTFRIETTIQCITPIVIP